MDVVNYKKLNKLEYELKLSCGHTIVRRKVSKSDHNGLPVRVICSACYKETHDKNGNRI